MAPKQSKLQVNGSGGSSSVHHGGKDVVETQLGPQLAELAISKAKNVSEASGGGGSSSTVGGKSQRHKQPRKIKALPRTELEAENQEMLTDDSGTSLPDGILEDIFLRLPFFDLRSVKRVCKTWEQVIVSQRFRRSYKSTATLVEEDCNCSVVHAMHFIEVRDISNKALRWRPGLEFSEVRDSSDKAFRCWKPTIHRTITSHINGLVIAFTYPNEEVYVCNIFANMWERVPVPVSQREYCHLDQMAIFDLGGGHYKVLYWKTKHKTSHVTSKVLVLEIEEGQKQQEKKWCEAYSDSDLHYTKPVVIGTSMFRVAVRHELLVEYNHEADKVKSTKITSTGEQGEGLFDLLNLGYCYLIVWQAKLHVVKQHDRDDVVSVWLISTGDGRATLLHRFRMGQRVDFFDVFEVDNEGVLHIEGRVERVVEDKDASIGSVWYDMAAKCVREKSVISGCTTSRRTRLPVRLCSS